ncbi:MAG: hypothetical protein JO146_05605 [Candidatus Eremiobacteraeota bacterium]|nr:hypothetical protein [Candidatus Eremiobacteraeota bacterium]
MTTSTALRASARAAFAALIDYAGLFPPAKLPAPQACIEYETARGGPQAWMLGRFILPAPLLFESPDWHEAPLSVIADGDTNVLERLSALRRTGSHIEALEIPIAKSISPLREVLSADEILDVTGELEAGITTFGLRDLPVYVEIPRAAPWWPMLSSVMDALARMQLRAKLRCGGESAEAFPSVDDVTDFIAAAAHAGVAFKATAGLHHPVRHVDGATGFSMHGFLNILAAAALAPRVDRETLARVVAEEDPAAFSFEDASFAWRDLRVELADLQRARREAFVAYGSCSFDEPVADLMALGILPPR